MSAPVDGYLPVHQPGVFNIEAWHGGRWHGGKNRIERGDAIATAALWAAEDGCRHRVFDPTGALVFDTESPPVDLNTAEGCCHVLQPLFDLGDVRDLNGPTGRRLAELICPRDAADLTVRELLALIDRAVAEANGAEGGAS